MTFIVLLLIAIILLGFNIKASLLILNDPLLELKQRVFQLLLVWLLPVIGAFLVLGIHQPLEKSSGKYPEEFDIDVFGSITQEEKIHGTNEID